MKRMRKWCDMYLLGFIIPILSFFLQIWPRLKNRYFGIDTWRHLMYAEYIRRNNRLPESITDRYITTAPFGYPPFLLIFLSFFPKKFADNYQFLFSPFFDFFHNYFIFLSVFLLSQNLPLAIFAQIISALTPVVVIEASNLNTRVVSYLFFSVSFFSLILFSVYQNFVFLIPASLGLVFLFFTHRFGVQAYLFTVVGFSIIERNPMYIVFFLCVFVAVFILGGNLYRRILIEHMGSLLYWAKNIDNRFSHQFRGIQKAKEAKDFIYNLYRFSQSFSFLFIFGGNPWLFVLILIATITTILHISFESFIDSLIMQKLILWTVISVFSTILVLSIKKLRFLGEGYRYIEYATFPVSFLVASYILYFIGNLFFFIGFLMVCVVVLIGVVFLQIKTVVKDRNRTIDKAKWEIIDYLNKTAGSSVRLGVFPMQLGDAMMYFIKGRVLTTDSLVGLQQLLDIFPVVTKPMNEIIKKYKINYIFFDKRYVTIKEMKLKKYRAVKDINDYVLLKV